ncbi:MAG: adenylate/guanylate cyclase domain-containing protein [Anaerolineales bacterium]
MPADDKPKFPEQRCLVSALYAELLGFSALADQLEPEAASSLMRDLWSALDHIIEEYGGYINKNLGDSILVIWGVPDTLEDDAERAVSASIALLEGLEKFQENSDHSAAKSLRFKGGIHTGLALTGYVGAKGEYTVLGDTLNIAKRLEETAEPGSLIISEGTYQLIRGAFQVKRLTPIQLKGTQRLVNIFQIVEELSQPTKLRYRSAGGLETILVGRDLEMSHLEDLFQITREGKKTQLVLVTGDVGVGKSRLLFEFAGHLETENPLLTVMSSRALEQTSRMPYYLWKELWSNRFEINEDDPVESAQKKTIDGVLTLWGKALGEITAVEAAHFLGDQIGVRWDKSRYLDSYNSDPKGRIERSFFLQAELFSRASQRGPIVLILDDLQWADSGSLSLIEYLWKSVEQDIPLLILTCARKEFIEENPQLFQEAEKIELSPLPVSSEIVREAYPALKTAPDKLLSALAERAQGNPYFLEELVKNVLGSEGFRLEDGDPLPPLPKSLEELLQSRLDSLSLEGRATAFFAAVAGRVFWKGAVLTAFRNTPSVTEALDVSSHNIVGKVQGALDELMEKELAFLRVGSAFSGEREYIFKHSLLREVAYHRLPDSHRAKCHAAVADWLAERSGPERSISVAHHYEAAGIYDKAQAFYTQAADYARSIGNLEEADDLRYHARTLPENQTE